MRHAIVGAGYGADVHLPAFKAQKNVEVVALCDGGSGRALGVAPESTMVSSDWLNMIERQKPDSISVVTPPTKQFGIVKAALERGIHVLCEKPFGLNIDEAQTMTLAASDAGCIGAIGYQFRYEPGILALKTQIDRGLVGSLRKLDVSWITAGRSDPQRAWSWQNDIQLGGGVINAFLTHILDLIQWILPEDAVRVLGCSRILIDHRFDEKGQKIPVTAEDQVDAIMEFESNVVANLRICNCQPEGHGLCIEAFGDMGRIVFTHQWPFRPEDARLQHFTKNASRDLQITTNILTSGMDSRLGAAMSLIQDYCISVETGKLSKNLPLFVDGLGVRRTVELLQQSLSNKG